MERERERVRQFPPYASGWAGHPSRPGPFCTGPARPDPDPFFKARKSSALRGRERSTAGRGVWEGRQSVVAGRNDVRINFIPYVTLYYIIYYIIIVRHILHYNNNILHYTALHYIVAHADIHEKEEQTRILLLYHTLYI